MYSKLLRVLRNRCSSKCSSTGTTFYSASADRFSTLPLPSQFTGFSFKVAINLSCRHLSLCNASYGASPFCPYCELSLGARRCRSCKKKTGNPLDAHHCIHCGGTSLSDAAAYLELGWLVRLLAWGTVFLIGRWTWFHFGLGGAASSSANPRRTWLDAVLIGAFELGRRIVIVGGAIYVMMLLVSSVISLVFPVSVGKGLNNLLAGSLKVTGRFLASGIKLGASWLYHMVEGGHSNGGQKPAVIRLLLNPVELIG